MMQAVSPEPQVAMTGASGSRPAEANAASSSGSFFHSSAFEQIAERKIERARHVAGAQAGARLGRPAVETLGAARVRHLRPAEVERAPHGLSVGDKARVETGRKIRWRSLARFALFERSPFRFPSGKAAREDRRMFGAEDGERPPKARRGENADAVIDDGPHPVAKSKPAHLGGEDLGFGQHMRQAAGTIGDGVDIEELRAGNMPRKKFSVRVAAGRRHMPRGVEDDEVGVEEMFGKPVGGNEK